MIRQWPWQWSRASTIAFFVACALLVAACDGAFLVHSPLGGFDWPKERFFYTTLRAQLRDFGTVPWAFFTTPPSMLPPVRYMPTLMHSSSYVGNPEVLTFSPLLPLLRVASVDLFLRVYFVAHLAAGAFGIWLVARRLRLPPWAALALFALTMLNPWVVQHLAIGYTPHITFALCPLVIALLAAPDFAIVDWLLASAVESLILYEGGLHVFNWLNGALLIFALAVRSRALLVRIGAIWLGAALLSAPKLAAVAQALGGWRRDPLPGIRNVRDLWGLLTDGRALPFRLPQAYGVYGTNLYDGAIYMGAPFVLLIVAALVLAIRRRSKPAVGLAAVAVVFTVLGSRAIWPTLAKLIPPLDVELYPYRFLFIALVAMIALVVWELALLVERGGRLRWLPLLLVPTLVATFVRTQEYAAQTTTPVPPDCTEAALMGALRTPPAALDEKQRPLPTTRVAGGFAIDAGDARLVTLPSVRAAQARDFVADGARIVRADQQSGVALAPSAARVRLLAASWHFWPIAAAGWLCFVALAVAASRLRRRT